MHSRSDSRHQPPTKLEANKEKFQWLEPDRKVWMQNVSKNLEDVFLEAKVVKFSEDSNKIEVRLMGHSDTIITSLDHCLKLTCNGDAVSDMVDLEELNEPELLFNIKRRYFKDTIFTYCGPTLLIINPYCKINELFSEQLLTEYQLLVFSETLEYKSQAPHIYGLAGFCLWQPFDNCRNQSIVISGESGAGKTENTKYCLNFLASLGRCMREISQRKGSFSMPRGLDKVIKKISPKLTGIEDRVFCDLFRFLAATKFLRPSETLRPSVTTTAVGSVNLLFSSTEKLKSRSNLPLSQTTYSKRAESYHSRKANVTTTSSTISAKGLQSRTGKGTT